MVLQFFVPNVACRTRIEIDFKEIFVVVETLLNNLKNVSRIYII